MLVTNAHGAEQAKQLYAVLALLGLSEKQLTTHYGGLMAEIAKSSHKLDLLGAVGKNLQRQEDETGREMEEQEKDGGKTGDDEIKLNPKEMADNSNRFVTNCWVSKRVFPPNGGLVVIAEGDYESKTMGAYSVRLYQATSANENDGLFPVRIDNFSDGLIQKRENGYIESVQMKDLLGDGHEEIIVKLRSTANLELVSANAFCVNNGKLVFQVSIEDYPWNAEVKL